jgi:hypothetical protein
LICAIDDILRCGHTALGRQVPQGYPKDGTRFVHRTIETGAAVSLL